MNGNERNEAIDKVINKIKEDIVRIEEEAKVTEAKILENVIEEEERKQVLSYSVAKLTDLVCEQIIEKAKGSLHIEEVVNKYGDDRDGEDPTHCVWQDVEALDYGWMWLRYRPEHMKEVMIARITEGVRALQKRMDDGEEFTVVTSVYDKYGHTVSFHVLDVVENQDSTVWTLSDKDTCAE